MSDRLIKIRQLCVEAAARLKLDGVEVTPQQVEAHFLELTADLISDAMFLGQLEKELKGD